MLQHLKQEVIQAIENILQKYRDRGQECSQEHQKIVLRLRICLAKGFPHQV